MKVSCFVPIILVLVSPSGGGAFGAHYRVGLGGTLLIERKGLTRVAVSNSNVTAKAFGPDEVLLFGKKEGRAELTLWAAGRVESHDVLVFPASRGEPSASEGRLVKVLLELLEFDRSRLEELGVRWPASQNFALRASQESGESGINIATPGGVLHHFSRTGVAHLLASPELFVREGEEAIFHSGGEFPVTSSTENYGRLHRHIDWKPFGVRVKVRPKSADGFHISSDIKVEISELNAGMAINGVPSVTKREIDTKTDSLDGETMLLSGLHRARTSAQREAVPWVERLPVFGPLFRVNRREGESSELLIAMTLSFARRVDQEKIGKYRERTMRGLSDEALSP